MGAAAGLALQAILRDALGEAAEARYTIRGTWENPLVEPVAKLPKSRSVDGNPESVEPAPLQPEAGKDPGSDEPAPLQTETGKESESAEPAPLQPEAGKESESGTPVQPTLNENNND